jgi:hypothetical protein
VADHFISNSEKTLQNSINVGIGFEGVGRGSSPCQRLGNKANIGVAFDGQNVRPSAAMKD